MKQQIELEYKMLLNKRQFSSLKSRYPFGYPFKQTNYYYDTKDMALGSLRYALRIREVNQDYILTLKIPQKIGVLELEQKVSSHLIIPDEWNESLREALHFINLEDLVQFGSLTTYRCIYEREEALICLDENFYHGIHDYEIEYEVKKEHDSYPTFLSFLSENGIYRHKPAMGKARRVKKANRLL